MGGEGEVEMEPSCARRSTSTATVRGESQDREGDRTQERGLGEGRGLCSGWPRTRGEGVERERGGPVDQDWECQW